MAQEADAAMRAVSEGAGKRENRCAVTVLMGRVAAVITRTSTRAVQKRQVRKRTHCTPDVKATMVRLVGAVVEPEQEDEALADDEF